MATSTRAVTKAGYCTVDEVFVPGDATGRRPLQSVCKARTKLSEEPLLQSCRRSSSRCSSTIATIVTPTHFSQNEMFLVGTEAGLETLVSAAPRSRGAFRCPTIRKHVMYVLVRCADELHDGGRLRLERPGADAERFEVLAGERPSSARIVRQHAIYWPAFLLAAGLPLPQARQPMAGG